jgi:phosphohistidine phosphatase
MDADIQLYLIRHGLAASRGDQFPDDAKRPLTPQGVTRLRREAAGLEALGVRFDIVLTSPLVRARQTAEVLAQALAPRTAVTELAALAPGGAAAATASALAEYSRHGAIALVGHEPDLGQLAARLIGTRAAIPFKKGAVCRIDMEALPPSRPGRLVWFVTPKMLRKLGKE